MGTRRLARECALKILYQIDLSNQTTEEASELFWKESPVSRETRQFAEHLVRGVLVARTGIDELLSKYSTHWKLNRMAIVDKNILRLAVFELQNFSEIPLKVTLNEAIEIGKSYGSEESSAFINGILDKVAKELKKD